MVAPTGTLTVDTALPVAKPLYVRPASCPSGLGLGGGGLGGLWGSGDGGRGDGGGGEGGRGLGSDGEGEGGQGGGGDGGLGGARLGGSGGGFGHCLSGGVLMGESASHIKGGGGGMNNEGVWAKGSQGCNSSYIF